MEGEVRRVRAVDQKLGVVATAQLGERRDVAGGAVIGGVQHPQRSCPALAERALDHVGVQAVRDAEAGIPARFEPDRPGTDLDQARQHRLVGVARHQHRLVGPQRRKRNGDIAAGRALHQDEALADAPRIGDESLGLEDRPFRAVQVVGVRQVVQVDCGDVLAKPRIQRAPALVARAVERCLVALDESPAATRKAVRRHALRRSHRSTPARRCGRRSCRRCGWRRRRCSHRRAPTPPSTSPIARRHNTEPSTWSSGGPNASEEYSCLANGAVSSASATSPVDRTPR